MGLLIGTVRRTIGRCDAHAHTQIVGGGEAKSVTVRVFDVATIIVGGAFLIFITGLIFIFTLILQGEVQAVNQTEEVIVTVGCNAVSAAGHKVIGLGVGVAAEFWQHIGPAFYVVQYAVITAIVE